MRLELLLRGRNLSADLPPKFQATTFLTYGTQGWLGGVEERDVRAPNLRWHLGKVDWDDDAICKAVADEAARHPGWERSSEAKWVGHIKRWIAEGI